MSAPVSNQRAEKNRPQAEAKGAPAKGAKGQPSGPIGEATALLSRGDVRGARQKLRAAVDEPGDPGQEARREARELLARIGVDPGALGAAAGVLVVIGFAVVSAILLRR